MDQYQQLLSGAFLAACSWTDIRSRIIYRKVLVMYLLLALIGRGLAGGMKWDTLLTGLMPGLACVCLSRITRERLGYGDSLLILVCGVSVGWQSCMTMTVWAFLLAGGWGMIVLCRKRGGRGESFPFVPFLMAGYLIENILKGG